MPRRRHSDEDDSYDRKSRRRRRVVSPDQDENQEVESGWQAQPRARAPRFDSVAQKARFDNFLGDEQGAAWSLMDRCRLVWLLGQAGTGKTHVAVCRALHELICTRSVRQIILLRPAVEAGERLGFLPGDMKAKVDPYHRAIYDILDEVLGNATRTREQVKRCLEVTPVAFLRGRTFKHSFVILDEGQNCSAKQIKMVLTRIGRGSRMVLTGDPHQSDLSDSDDPQDNAFGLMAARFSQSRLVQESKAGVFTFRTVVRDPLIEGILDAIGEKSC